MTTMSLQGIGQFAPLAGVKTRYTPSRFTLDGYQDYPRLQITGRWFAQPPGLVDGMTNPVALEVDGVPLRTVWRSRLLRGRRSPAGCWS